MPIVCRVGFGLPGVRQGSEATRPVGLVPGSGRVVATGRNDLRGSHRWAVSNPLKSSPSCDQNTISEWQHHFHYRG